MAFPWVIGGVTLNVPMYQGLSYTDEDQGATIGVISGFSPSVVGRSAGRQGERGQVTHVESGATHQAVIDAINDIRAALMPDFPAPGYHDMTCPHFSGRVRLLSVNPTYPEPAGAAVGYVAISWHRVHV